MADVTLKADRLRLTIVKRFSFVITQYIYSFLGQVRLYNNKMICKTNNENTVICQACSCAWQMYRKSA